MICTGNLFRIILAVGNDTRNDKQTSEIPTERWAMFAYARNLSAHVVNHLLENSANYCIVPIAEPTEGSAM